MRGWLFGTHIEIGGTDEDQGDSDGGTLVYYFCITESTYLNMCYVQRAHINF